LDQVACGRCSFHFSKHFHPAYHVGVLECAVLRRHRHLPVDDECGTNPELGAKGGRKPHSIWLSVIDDIKPNSRNIYSQQSVDHNWNAPCQLGKQPHGLEFRSIDVRLARPWDLVLVLWLETDVVNAATLLHLLTEEFEGVIVLLLAGMCWFKTDATEHISRIWQMVQILERDSMYMKKIRTDKPGYVIYEDARQLVADPSAKVQCRENKESRPKVWTGKPQAQVSC